MSKRKGWNHRRNKQSTNGHVAMASLHRHALTPTRVPPGLMDNEVHVCSRCGNEHYPCPMHPHSQRIPRNLWRQLGQPVHGVTLPSVRVASPHGPINSPQEAMHRVSTEFEAHHEQVEKAFRILAMFAERGVRAPVPQLDILIPLGGDTTQQIKVTWKNRS
jgi:hypothetical protein